MKKPEILYSPQECDRNHCHDDFCPYLHSPMWQYRKEDMTLSDGYDSEQEAIDAYYVYAKRKELSDRLVAELTAEWYMEEYTTLEGLA